jgi:hypothetical protein
MSRRVYLLGAGLALVALAFELTMRLLPRRRGAGENARVVRLRRNPDRPRYLAAVPVSRAGGLPWTGDIEAALAQARREDKQVLLAFVALTDTNAKINTENFLPQRAVQDALEPYVRVMLYVDYVPDTFFSEVTSTAQREAEGKANEKLLMDGFDTHEEPLYAVVEPVGWHGFAVIGAFTPGRMSDSNPFVRFLRDPAPGEAVAPFPRLRAWLGW